MVLSLREIVIHLQGLRIVAGILYRSRGCAVRITVRAIEGITRTLQRWVSIKKHFSFASPQLKVIVFFYFDFRKKKRGRTSQYPPLGDLSNTPFLYSFSRLRQTISRQIYIYPRSFIIYCTSCCCRMGPVSSAKNLVYVSWVGSELCKTSRDGGWGTR